MAHWKDGSTSQSNPWTDLRSKGQSSRSSGQLWQLETMQQVSWNSCNHDEMVKVKAYSIK